LEYSRVAGLCCPAVSDGQDGSATVRRPGGREIAQAIVALHRRFYGRGATKARTYFVDDHLLIVELRDIFITVEQSLVDRGQEDTVRATRQTFQSAMRDEFIHIVEELTGRRVENYDSVVFVHPQMALEIFMLESAEGQRERVVREAAEDAGEPRPTAGIEES
jgi:uncharacterized protein YbcI